MSYEPGELVCHEYFAVTQLDRDSCLTAALDGAVNAFKIESGIGQKIAFIKHIRMGTGSRAHMGLKVAKDAADSYFDEQLPIALDERLR